MEQAEYPLPAPKAGLAGWACWVRGVELPVWACGIVGLVVPAGLCAGVTASMHTQKMQVHRCEVTHDIFN